MHLGLNGQTRAHQAKMDLTSTQADVFCLRRASMANLRSDQSCDRTVEAIILARSDLNLAFGRHALSFPVIDAVNVPPYRLTDLAGRPKHWTIWTQGSSHEQTN